MCKASVIMPCYNTPQEYLRESVLSILHQTHHDFELIIVDDGSDPETQDVLNELSRKDSRIVLLRNAKNEGLAYSLNRALSAASGKYIFRMDSDDISLPDRLETTVRYMEKHVDVDVAGTQCLNLLPGKRKRKHTKQPASNDDIKAHLLYSCPIVHPTVCFRKSSLEKSHIRYDHEKTEDYSMWVNCAINGFTFANLNNVLLLYRIHESQVTHNSEAFRESSTRVRERLFRFFGISVEDEAFRDYNSFCFGKNTSYESVKNADRFLADAIDKIPESYADKDAVEKTIVRKLFHECLRLALRGDTEAIYIFRYSKLTRGLSGRFFYLTFLFVVSRIANVIQHDFSGDSKA